MANVGAAAAGKTLIGTGVTGSPTFASIGTSSGLTSHGVILGQNLSAFVSTTPGTDGQLLIGAGGADPAFSTVTSSDGSIAFTVGPNSLSMVVASGTAVGKRITGDSGGALSPTLGNWNILGLSGSKTSGSGSTLTIKSPPYADQGAPITVTLNSGSFATAAITLTTPATAGLADGDLLEFVATNGVLIIQLAATQVGHLGNTATTVAGTFTSTATGDSISLRYQASTNDFWSTSSIGNWVLA